MNIQELDHLTLAESRPTDTLQTAENFQKLIKVFIEEAQVLEQELLKIANAKDLDTVVGIWLDYIGKIVGESRGGKEDEPYRQALKLKIAINLSDGTPDVMSEILEVYTKSDRVRLAEGIMAWGQFIVDGDHNMTSDAYSLLQDIKPATTNILLLQDTDKKCFFPAWELSVPKGELFELVLSGGITDSLELVLNSSGDTTLLSVSNEEDIISYDEETTSSMFLEWEEPSEFEVVLDEFGTTSILELEASIGVITPYLPEGLTAGPTGEVLLPWEINENSTV